MLTGKRILLGVTGGIAAYKSAFLVRELVRAGAEVQVIMTRSATQFVAPLTFSTLARREVVVEMFPPSPEQPTMQWTKHIELGMWGDAMMIAPASANTIAKIAHGIADNFLTTLVLALRAPLAIAPAMDVDMYLNEITQRNIAALRETGCHIIEPESGPLASGLSGPGRLPEVDRLVRELDGLLANARRDLEGKSVLVTAGPTHEPIDPVRFLGNRSSGKMGFAVAAAAAQRGATVTLVAGPVMLRTPRNVKRIDVETARDMARVVGEEFLRTDLLVMSAAVADFAPVRVESHKIKRARQGKGGFALELEANPDILLSLAERKKSQVMVGFALETEDGVANARAKLRAKNLDLVVLNNPLEEGAGFGGETNVVTLVQEGMEPESLPKMAKIDVAHAILSRVRPLVR